MIRNILFPLAAAAALSAGGAATAQPPAQAPAQGQQPQRLTAAALVEGIRPHLPRQFEGGAILRGARAEGDLVIMTVEVPPEWLARGVAIFTQGFTDGMCSARENPFFDNGLSLRIDTMTGGGEPTAGQVLSSCPGR